MEILFFSFFCLPSGRLKCVPDYIFTIFFFIFRERGKGGFACLQTPFNVNASIARLNTICSCILRGQRERERKRNKNNNKNVDVVEGRILVFLQKAYQQRG